MKNTTKLKNILQLYNISLDMDDDGNFYLTAISKRTKSAKSFCDKAYSVVIGKAFSHMMKEIKKIEKNIELNNEN